MCSIKKSIILTVAIIFSATVSFAQGMAEATEIAKTANEQLQMSNYEAALGNFIKALTIAETCGDEGAELVGTCQGIIPKIELSIGKDLIKNKKFDEAVTQMEKVKEVASKYGDMDIVEQATKFIPQIFTQKGNDCLSSKNYTAAIDAFNKLLENDPENGVYYLRIGMAQNGLGKKEEAKQAFEKAAQYGQKAVANKQISNIFLKDASAALSKGRTKEAIEAALESCKYEENANAYKIAGTAASKLPELKKDAVTYLQKYLQLAPNAKDKAAITSAIEALKK